MKGYQTVNHWLARTSAPAVLLAEILLLSTARAEEQPTSSQPVDATQEERPRQASIPAAASIDGLVRSLGNPQYAVRRESARLLTALGAAARPALVAALKNPDAEIRRQAQLLLPAVLADDDRRRIEAFRAGTPESEDNRLPGWRRFRGIAGDSPQARELFAEMARAEPLLLEAIEQSPAEAARVTDTLLTDATSKGAYAKVPASMALSLCLRTIAADRGDRPAEADMTPRVMAILASLLLASSEPGSPIEDSSHSTLKDLIELANGRDAMSAGTPLRRLTGRWVTCYRNSEQASNCLSIAQSLNLREGRQTARRILEEAYQPPSLKRTAIMTVAHLGTVKDFDTLVPLLADASSCDDDESACPQQVRDVALAAIVHLAGESPAAYGMPQARVSEETAYDANSLRFPDEQTRTAALRKWRFWSVALAVPGRERMIAASRLRVADNVSPLVHYEVHRPTPALCHVPGRN